MAVAKSNGTTSTTTSAAIEKEKLFQSNRLQLEEDEEEDSDGEDEEIKPEDLAPDGGWGWMIALAMIVVFITLFGPGASFGLIFGDFLEETSQAGIATTMFNSVFMATFSVSGLITNTILKKYCIRTVGVASAVITAVPNVALAFVSNIYEMAFIFAIQGFGIGFIVTICNTNFNAYFVKKRARVMSAAQVIIGVGGIVYPICIELMMEAYGFRGTAVLTGAMSLNCIVGMTMMHPVEWHSKKPEEVRAERARKREEKATRRMAILNRRSTIDVIQFSHKKQWGSLRSLKEESGKEVPLLVEMFKSPVSRVVSISEMESGTRNRARSVSAREALSRRMSNLSSSSVANLVTGVGALGDIRQYQLEKSRELKAEKKVQSLEKEKQPDLPEDEGDVLTQILEMSLLKDRSFLNLCLGISFIFTGDYVFSVFLPLMMTDNGYTKSDAALAVTVSAFAELVSRALLAIFTFFIDVKAKYLFFGAMVSMAFAKIAYLLYEKTLMGSLVTIAIIGMVRSWLLVPQPLVIIEDIPVDKFASAYGIFTVISGIISIVFSPIIGIVKDWTDSFRVCQLALLGMSSVFIIPWAIQFLVVDLPKRRKERADKIASRTSGSFSSD